MKETPRLNIEQIHQDKHILNIELQSLLNNPNQGLSDIIKYLDNYFSLLERSKGYDYIQRNLEIERNFNSICNRYEHMFITELDPEDFLCLEELEAMYEYNHYMIQMDDVESQKNNIINDIEVILYADILGLFSDYFFQMQQVIPVLVKSTLNKNKVYFDEVIEHLNKNYLTTEKQVVQPVECPLSEEQMEIFDYITSKYASKKNIFFSYVYQAMLDYDVERGKELEKDKLKRKKSIFFDSDFKKKYFSWLNKIYFGEFKDQITYHNNLSSQKKIDQIKQHIKDYRNDIL